MIDKLKDHWNDFIAHPWIPLTKILGYFMIWPALPFRAWSRNYVYAHILKNGLPLKRLRERKPKRMTDGWVLQDIHNVEDTNGFSVIGFIRERKTSTIGFYLVVIFLWGWLDDDSNQDTTDMGHIKQIKEGKHKWSLTFWANPFTKYVDAVYGNSFDLGDTRSSFPFQQWANTLVWTDRNTAMNFKYLWANY